MQTAWNNRGDPVRLREPLLEDAEALFALIDRDRQDLRRYLPWVDQTLTVQDELRYLQQEAELAELDGRKSWLIELGGRLAGRIGFHYLNSSDQTEIGYFLASPWRGRGLMTEAVRALAQYALVERGIVCLQICVAETNLASIAVARRAGDHLSGRRPLGAHRDGLPEDGLIFSLSREEWLTHA